MLGEAQHVRQGYEILANLLQREGVTDLFGLMGEANVHLIAYAVERLGMRYFSTRHEAGAVGMAEGFARSGGKIGVATVTYGPGLTNAITAITTAARNRAPVLIITGQREPGLKSRNQYIDQFAMLLPTGAAVFMVSDIEDIATSTEAALRFIRTHSLPAVLSLSPELAEGALKIFSSSKSGKEMLPTQVVAPSPDNSLLESFAQVLTEARRPVILAGRGAILANAVEDLADLAERIDAALMTTLLANGAFAGNERNLGISGGFGTDASQQYLEEADVVAVFGASLNIWTTRMGKAYPKARVLHCDHDTAALDSASVPTSIRLACDVREVVRLLLERLPPRGEVHSHPSGADRVNAPPSESLALHPAAVFEVLDQLLPSGRTVTLDAGHFFEFPARHLSVPDLKGFLFTAGFGSIGLGLATALGAAVGRQDRLSVAVLGDGGFLMSLAELDTAVRYRLPILVVVVNDGGYGAEVKVLEHHGWSPSLATFQNPEIAKLAQAFGATAITVRSQSDLNAVRDHLPLDGPLLVDVQVDPTVTAHWVELARTGA